MKTNKQTRVRQRKVETETDRKEKRDRQRGRLTETEQVSHSGLQWVLHGRPRKRPDTLVSLPFH